MFQDLNNDDPLGLGVKGRAREKRLAASLQGLMPAGGPLADPNWDAYAQAVEEAAGGKKVRYGYVDQPEDDLSRDPAAVASQIGGMPFAETFNGPSTQLGTPYEKTAPYQTDRQSLKGLRKQLRTR